MMLIGGKQNSGVPTGSTGVILLFFLYYTNRQKRLVGQFQAKVEAGASNRNIKAGITI